MKKISLVAFAMLMSILFVGCADTAPRSSNKNDDAAFEQFKAKKGQDELSAEIAKSKAEK